MSMGAAEINFREPLRAPMERLRIEGRMGGGAFGALGNASPRELDVSFSMGGVNLDLGGGWRQDARIDVTSQMGGVSIHLPEGVHLEGLGSDVKRPEPTQDPGAPTLTFSLSAQEGKLEFY